MKNAVIHDIDNDGIMAAAIVSLNIENIDFFPMSPYSKKEELIPRLNIGKYDNIYMLDLSASPEIMNALENEAKNIFYWFDHHKSAVQLFNKYKGSQDFRKSTTKLVWEWFYTEKKFMPRAVEYTHRYDIFEGEETDSFLNEVIPFQCFMERVRSVNVYKKILTGVAPSTDLILSIGKTLWEDELNVFKNMNFKKLTIIGKNALISQNVYNVGRVSYLLRKKGVKCDFYINQMKKAEGTYIYSIRSLSEGADCLDIIKNLNLNGGGHVAAAGFSSQASLFY